MNNVDFEGAKPYVFQRSPFLEFQTLTTDERKQKMLSGIDDVCAVSARSTSEKFCSELFSMTG